MADFKTALEALAKGNLDVEVLTKQLSTLLDKTPQYANRMLSQLDEMHDQKGISDQVYASLKSQINQYRRSHKAETETGADIADEATVFAQEDNVQDNAAATSSTVDEEATQVIAGGADSVDEATQVLDTTSQSDTAGFDVTGATDMSDVDIDLSAIGDPSITSATGPAGLTL